MVQVLADPTFSQHAGHARTPEHEGSRQDGGMMSREEHAQRMRELNMKRSMMRAPRRGWSMTEYQGDNSAPQYPSTNAGHQDRPATIPENAVLPPVAVAPPIAPSKPVAVEESTAEIIQTPSRPKLPPPRRSYSVTDYEPTPPDQPKPSTRMTLLDLPSEVHYLFFDHLDPIDSVCFGLANSQLYGIHRRMHPKKISLATRYTGPNDREWAWRGAGPLVRSATQDLNELSRMRVQGQVYCRKCGISRCELHRHIREWMGEGRQYCEIREKYGPKPSEEAPTECRRKSPKNPNRCSRHGGNTSA